MTYKIQIDDQVRDATPAEVAAIEAQRAGSVDVKQLIADQQAAAASARIKLAKLGLTEAEVAALLGA